MKEQYLSLDIETSALEPDEGVVLQVGAILDDMESEIATLPRYNKIIRPTGPITGTPVALMMNFNILSELAALDKGGSERDEHWVWDT
ncbi:MAG: hypothetical protein KDA84_19445, partial [Planctomycetaceae bacterium]|nr:hypothetical protein [Planctomycetaceae bacterium]